VMAESATKQVFLIDSNSFIAPFRSYYPMAHFPSYWDWLQKIISQSAARVIIPKSVYDELTSGDDELAVWVKDNLEPFVYDESEDAEVWKKYREVINYVHASGCYRGAGMTNWDKLGKADPLLIAVAAVKGWKIVTFERSAGHVSPQNPMTKEPKIPDVAKVFGVVCVTLYSLEDEFALNL